MPDKQGTAVRYFKLRNSSGNIIGLMVRNEDGGDEVWKDMNNTISPNDAHWVDLANETDGKVKQGQWYKLGAHVKGPMNNEWDGNRLWRIDPHSNKMVTYTYTLNGVSLDGVVDRQK